jgi:hypothetical protein
MLRMSADTINQISLIRLYSKRQPCSVIECVAHSKVLRCICTIKRLP